MLSISLLNVNYFCAATDEQGLEGETAENLTVNTTNMDTDNLELETTTDSDSEESFNETSENSTNTSTQNNLNETEITDDNTSDHENPQDNNSSVNILNIDDESMLAAGGDSYDNVTGIWMWSSHINSLNVTSLLNSGITDIFLYVNSTNYQTNINSLLEKLQDTGIRVHAWISCFKDSDDNWIDPKNTTHTNNLLNLISDIVSTTDVNGIHLDYVRYSGVGNNAAYKHENGTETITSFVENVYNTVKSIKTKVAVSAALMPEKSVNAYYYGQDYSQLSQFLDFLVPMIYKGNYNEDTDWIASTTEYIVGQANGKPVVAGIQTYRSDSDITKLSADELNQDINAASDGGSSGYVLFRYGLIDENFWNSVNQSGDDSVSFTIDQIKSAAVWVKAFVEANGKLPDSVTIASKQVSMSQLLQLLTSSVLQINQGVTTPIKLLDVGSAPNPCGSLVSGNVSKSEYLKVAGNLLSFFESNDRAPNYGVYSLGNVQFDYLVYSYSKIMDFYATNKRLPNYAIIKTSEMSSTNPLSFTIDQIKSAAVWVKAFVEANGKLPDSVTIASKQVSMSQLLQLLTSSVLQINQGVTTPIKLLDVGSAPNPSGAIVSGNVSKSEYLKVAGNLLSFFESNDRAPNYGVYSLGNVQFDYLVYSYSKIMDFYATNKRLPNYAIIKTSEMSGDNSGNEPGDDSVSFTIDQIKSAAVWVKAFVEANGKLPDSVTIASKQVSMSQLLQLLTSSVLQINQGVTTPIKLLDVGSAPNPSGAIVSGNVSKSEYLKVAGNLLAFIDSKGRAPNWGVYSLGNVQFDYLVYSYSKIMDFYATNKRLPSYAIIKTAEMGYDSSIPEELLIYLQETKNAQSTNATIIALAKSITNGLTTNYEKADAIFKWVRDNLSYSFYYNTKYGATGILQTLDGNCIDHSHLIVALSRSVGIPARYGHAQCKFSSMTVGHVWAELYVNGKWYIADATSSRNTLGVMQNCQILYLKGANGTGIWRELPF